ncbi:MAG: FecR domain-containing protein [Dongiaceae bacterium]
MRSIVPAVAALIATAVGLSAEMATAQEIGAVRQRTFNGAVGLPPGGEERDLLFNNDVFAEERVSTDGSATTSLQFLDNTRLKVGSNSTLVLDRFVYDPDTETGELAITFGKGIFRFVTGEINKNGIRLNTPTASMTVRGTDVIIEVKPDDTTLISVIEGTVDVVPCGGEPRAPGTGQSVIVPASCTSTEQVEGRITRNDPGVSDGSASFGSTTGNGSREREPRERKTGSPNGPNNSPSP